MKNAMKHTDFESRQRYFLHQGKEEMIRLIEQYYESDKSNLSQSLDKKELPLISDLNLSCICIFEENRGKYQKFTKTLYPLLKNVIENTHSSSFLENEKREQERQKQENLTMMKNMAGLPLEYHSTWEFDKDEDMTSNFTIKTIMEQINTDEGVEQEILVGEDVYSNSLMLMSLCNYLIEKKHKENAEECVPTGIKYFKFSEFLLNVDFRKIEDTNKYILDLRNSQILFIDEMDVSILNNEKKFMFEDLLRERKKQKKKTFYTEV